MVGGPGSGKSASQKKAVDLIGTKHPDYVIVDPDRVLSVLFNSDNSCYPRITPVLQQLVDTAYTQKKNIILDTTGRDFQRSRKFAQRFKHSGYITVVCITHVDPDIALARAEKRALMEGRRVDEEYLRFAYEAIQANIPRYIDCRYFDKVFFFNNTGAQLVSELSFDRESACQVFPKLCGNINSQWPKFWASVLLYDRQGPVEEISIPYEVSGNMITFKYSWTELVDWTITLNGTHVIESSDPACVYPYMLSTIEGDRTLSFRVSIAEDRARCIPSLPQKGSRFWQARAPDQPLILSFVLSSTEPQGVCIAETCAASGPPPSE
jgi:predicted ABC-type ATPase